MLLDFADIVVHVQHEEERVFYALERLWKDCPVDPVRRPRRAPGRQPRAGHALTAGPRRVVLLRHGRTGHNASRRHPGPARRRARRGRPGPGAARRRRPRAGRARRRRQQRPRPRPRHRPGRRRPDRRRPAARPAAARAAPRRLAGPDRPSRRASASPRSTPRGAAGRTSPGEAARPTWWRGSAPRPASPRPSPTCRRPGRCWPSPTAAPPGPPSATLLELDAATAWRLAPLGNTCWSVLVEGERGWRLERHNAGLGPLVGPRHRGARRRRGRPPRHPRQPGRRACKVIPAPHVGAAGLWRSW